MNSESQADAVVPEVLDILKILVLLRGYGWDTNLIGEAVIEFCWNSHLDWYPHPLPTIKSYIADTQTDVLERALSLLSESVRVDSTTTYIPVGLLGVRRNRDGSMSWRKCFKKGDITIEENTENAIELKAFTFVPDKEYLSDTYGEEVLTREISAPTIMHARCGLELLRQESNGLYPSPLGIENYNVTVTPE